MGDGEVIGIPVGRDDDGLLAGEEGVRSVLAWSEPGGQEQEPYVRVRIGVFVEDLTLDENQRKVAMNDSRRANR